ncbi:hypothetical protein BDP81DRAFT_176052 [Colletotrichum phormii]|uniref:Uncharacterized protein n=1 Tax=Colletotrichum phormii TaxID=359342 RepID=A0AAJ0EJT4_9PEZI|nr:uncharacterized protein BDP81DRAFT_176052 [Colletotrichum phormii]KAK1639356.1 hypothetical protein BDP81DRAFT_176052 [Colletotrichum phormii]
MAWLPCHATSSTAVVVVVGGAICQTAQCLLGGLLVQPTSRYGHEREVTDYLTGWPACLGRGWALLASESRSASIRCISGADATRRCSLRRCLWTLMVRCRDSSTCCGRAEKGSLHSFRCMRCSSPPSHPIRYLTRHTSRTKSRTPAP